MRKDSLIYVAGHRGMVGSAVLRALGQGGWSNLLLPSREELDLCDSAQVDACFERERPEAVVVAAARVGGIHANSAYPAVFIRDNLAIALNVIHAAYENGVQRLLFLGSSCIYPRKASQPMREDCVLTSALEPTNEPYAIAKIAGLKLCQYYRKQYGVCFHSAMPTNLYGPGDNYHPENSHAFPALIRRFIEAREAATPSVALWGTGSPRREFLHVEDLAHALIHLLKLEDPPDWINVGTGTDVSIAELAGLIAREVGYEGKLDYDTSRPDGTPRKLLDVSRLNATGWKANISLEEGIHRTCEDFRRERAAGRLREV